MDEVQERSGAIPATTLTHYRTKAQDLGAVGRVGAHPVRAVKVL